MTTSSRIVELSALIHENTRKVDEFINSSGLPSPSFDISQPPMLPLPPHIQILQKAVINATDELKTLMLGPIGSIVDNRVGLLQYSQLNDSAVDKTNAKEIYSQHNYLSSLKAIQHFKIAYTFPADKTSTFSAIAQAVSLPESDIRRILRHAMTYYIFREPTPGIVAHTALSKALVDVPPFGALIGFMTQEMWTSSTRFVDALVKWPGSEEPNQAGYSLAHATELPMFQLINQDSARAQQMGAAMALMHAGPGYSIKYVLDSFDWGAAAEGVLVDIGGGTGTITAEISRHFPKIKCIVQDLPEVVEAATVPEDLKENDRLKFVVHDFFEEQSIKDADIYYLRWILHDVSINKPSVLHLIPPHHRQLHPLV